MEDSLNLIAISGLSRHDREILSCFIKDASEPQRAFQYIYEQCEDGKLVKLEGTASLWGQVVTKVLQPAVSANCITSALFTREDYKCRITQQPSRYLSEKLEAVSIVSPVLFDSVFNENENAMLLGFLGPEILEGLQELLNRIYNDQTKDEDYPELQNMCLATRSMKEAFHEAHYAFFPCLKLCWKSKNLQVDPKAPDSIDLDLVEQRAHVRSNRNIISSRTCQWTSSAFTHIFELFPYLASESFRIYCYRTTSRLSSNLHAPQGIVQRVPGGIIVKRGLRVSTNEISALHLLAHNPFIPTPLLPPQRTRRLGMRELLPQLLGKDQITIEYTRQYILEVAFAASDTRV